MSNFKQFDFAHAVTVLDSNGKAFVVSTVVVYAKANLYPDGTVRTVDIMDVMDTDNNNIGSWIGFIECKDGNLSEVLEQTATAHAVGLYEEHPAKKDTGEQPEETYDPFDIFGSLGRALRPSPLETSELFNRPTKY